MDRFGISSTALENQTMESLICPICKKQLSDANGAGEANRRRSGEKLYCPSCEMLVDPLASAENRVRVDASDNRGRIRSGGSNAGGSQRGDMSDEGASQWRKDPEEGKR